MIDDTRARVENLGTLKSLAINILDVNVMGLPLEDVQRRSLDYLAAITPRTIIGLVDQLTELEIRLKTLKAEQAKAAAVQWVDLKREQPEAGRLIVANTDEFNGKQYYIAISPPEDMPRDYLKTHLKHKGVKRWAYVPEPPEAAE